MTTVWPAYSGPDDLASIEAVPVRDRHLPASVYDLLRAAAQERPDSVAHRTMRDGAAWIGCHLGNPVPGGEASSQA